MDKLEILFKTNKLIKTRHDLSLEQNRIMQEIFLIVQKEHSNIVSVPKATFTDILGNNNTKKNIAKIEELLNDIIKNAILIRDGDSWTKCVLIASVKYISEEEIFNIEVPLTLLNLLYNYKKDGFTPVNVVKYASLGSTNAQRLYELLRMWSGNKNIIEYKVDEIKEFLMLENKYKIFKDFKRRVIEPAVKELKERNMLDIYNIEYIKKGKKIDSIRFHVKDLETRNYNFKISLEAKEKYLNESINVLPNNLASLHLELLDNGITKIKPNRLEELNEKYGYPMLQQAVNIVIKNNSIKKISAPLKYINSILENLKETKIKSNKNNFANFTQREYDYDKLEKQLLGWDNEELED